MNQEKFEKKIQKKYGIKEDELSNLSISRIRKLKLNEKALKKQNAKFKVVKKPLGVIAKGASIGASVAGIVNTALPNLIPVIGAHLNAISNSSTTKKIFGDILLASKPVDLISGYGVIGIGAGIGVLAYSGYKLIKGISSTMSIASDRHKAKKLTKNNNG